MKKNIRNQKMNKISKKEDFDKIGKKIGFLEIIDVIYVEKTIKSKIKSVKFITKCACGNIVHLDRRELNHSIKKKCSKNCEYYIKQRNSSEIGKIFRKLKVIGFSHQAGKDSELYWNCICECGNTCVYSTKVLHKVQTSCGCELKRNGEKLRKNYKDISGSYYGYIKINASRRKLDFSISIKYIYDIYKNQDKKCYFTNLDIPMYPDYYNNDIGSLDRIDSSKGYIEGNVQWVHKDINFMKWDLTNEQFINYAKYINNFNGKLEYKEIEVIKRNRKFTGFGNISGQYWSSIKYAAKSRNIEFNLKIEDVWELYKQQGGRCSLSGLEIVLGHRGLGTASIDRINSDQSYNLDNIQWVHKNVNKIKCGFDQKYFLNVCKLIDNNFQ